MIQDDVYRHTLQGTIEGLRYWVPSIADVAHISEDGGPDFWHLQVAPKSTGGCSFEMLLRHDQHYDLVLADQSYEFLPVPSLAIFMPLAEAIIEGRVVQRRWSSTQTGALRAVETLIKLGDGSIWREGSQPDEGCESRDHHFLPYRR